MKIRNTRDLKHYWGRWMIYGDPGSYKTRCAATFPKPLFLTVTTEGGILSLLDQQVDYVNVTTPDDVLDELEDLAAMADASKLRHDTLVVDSLTILQDNQIDKLLENRRGATEKKRREKGIKDWKVDSDDVVNLADADWGMITTALRSMFVAAHALPMHVVWIAHAFREYSKVDSARDQQLIAGYPAIYTRNAARRMGGVCSFLWYAEVQSTNTDPIYRLYTSTHDRMIARSRGNLPPSVKPNFKEFSKRLGLSSGREE